MKRSFKILDVVMTSGLLIACLFLILAFTLLAGLFTWLLIYETFPWTSVLTSKLVFGYAATIFWLGDIAVGVLMIKCALKAFRKPSAGESLNIAKEAE
jgi:hypothetical protein